MEKKTFYMLLGDLGILTVALVWGTTNVIIKDALSGITPFWFCGLRFLIAFSTVALFFGNRALAMPAKARIAGFLTGMVFICAYLVGAAALLYTTAGNQSFIISMSVVFVPMSVWFLSRKFPGWHIILAVLLCSAGMAGLMLDDDLSVNIGDALCFASMLFVTAYIILVQKFVADADPFGMSCWQALGGMILALAVAFLFEPVPVHIPTAEWIAVVYAATVGFAMTLVVQTTAQKYTTATHTAILLSTSGVFGSALGVMFLGEPMTFRIFVSSAAELLPILRSSGKKAETKKS